MGRDRPLFLRRPEVRRWLRGSSREDPFLRKIWHSTRERWQRFALLGITVWATYALVLSPSGWIQLSRLRGRANDLNREISSLTAARDSLDQILADWSICGPQHLERSAREDYGFARANERIYRLPFDEEDSRRLRDGWLHGGDRFSDRALARRAK
jgi:cell division protein FtsB